MLMGYIIVKISDFVLEYDGQKLLHSDDLSGLSSKCDEASANEPSNQITVH